MVETEFFDIEMPHGKCDCYAAFPQENENPRPVLLYMDAFGPRQYLYEMAQKIASEGYYVLLPNLLYRVRRAPLLDVQFPLKMEDMPKAREQIMPMVQNFDPPNAVKEAGAFLDYFSEIGHKEKIGITGYCMGGGMALRTAAAFPDRVGAVASFHAGQLATDKPDSPHLLLPKIKAEVFIGHADKDGSMPPEQIERFEQALKSSGLKYQTEIFKGAMHGFTMADLPAYNEEALARHWERLFTLLKRH